MFILVLGMEMNSTSYADVGQRDRKGEWLARRFISVLARFTMTWIGRRISDVQIRNFLGRPVIFTTYIVSCVWLIDVWNPRETTTLIALFVLSAGLSILLLGIRFPRLTSRIVGFVGYKKVAVHLLRVCGTKEKRAIREDLKNLVVDAVAAKIHSLSLTSPVLCRPREAKHVAMIIEAALAQSGAAWSKVVSKPQAMGAAHSLNFKWAYGDTMTEAEMEGMKPHLLFGRIPTGIRLVPARTIRYTILQKSGEASAGD